MNINIVCNVPKLKYSNNRYLHFSQGSENYQKMFKLNLPQIQQNFTNDGQT